MSSNSGIDRLIDDACADFASALALIHERAEGTPIEKLFETGLIATHGYIKLLGHDGSVRKASFSPQEMPENQGNRAKSSIYYWPQYRVLDWKVDFLIGVRSLSGKPRFVVVECDGHDFHERTKEQAEKDRSRDRRLQDAGYRIYRFTGREIYREAMKCAGDALTGLLEYADMGRD